MDKNLLISFEEYSTIKHNRPYFYFAESLKRVLYYFGAEHKKDLTHPQFESLQKKWQEFLKKTSGTKSVVIFEGNVNIDSVTALKEAVEKYGESGAIVFWANQEHIPYFRPEPTIEYEAEKLLKEFSKEEIFYFYIIRGIASWQRATARKEFDEFIESNVKRYQDELGWTDFDFSFETIKSVHRHIFDKEFDLDDKDFIAKIPNPMHFESKINEIARESSTIRNIAILDDIEKYWLEGYSIFIVYGASHAVMQERAIKDMVETQS